MKPKPIQTTSPPALMPNWAALRDTPIEEAAAILNLEPTIVYKETPLNEVAHQMLDRPNVHVACVLTKEGRLVGLLGLRSLADDIFFHILPEEFLSEINDLEEAMEFASRSQMTTAGDAMQEPVWVKHGETVKNAFKRMHEHRLTGLPIVDEKYHVVGYINLLELLALCMDDGEPSSEKGSP